MGRERILDASIEIERLHEYTFVVYVDTHM